jgi:acetone carboxylase gamma subunit
MNRSVSPTLELRKHSGDERICCRGCGAPLAAAGTSWKAGAALRERPLSRTAATAYGGAPDVLLREFSCGQCGALLESEIALRGEPFLEDIVQA